LVACGGSDDNDSVGATETSIPAPTSGEEINFVANTVLDGTRVSNCAPTDPTDITEGFEITIALVY